MSCSRTQHGGGRSRTPDLSLRSPTLYHWATALPCVFRENRCPHTTQTILWWALIIQTCTFGNIPANGWWNNMQTSIFWLKIGTLSPAVTLKIKSRSPKADRLFTVSQCYIHANSVKIRQPVHEISCWQETVNLIVTLKIRSKSPKSNLLLILIQ